MTGNVMLMHYNFLLHPDSMLVTLSCETNSIQPTPIMCKFSHACMSACSDPTHSHIYPLSMHVATPTEKQQDFGSCITQSQFAIRNNLE